MQSSIIQRAIGVALTGGLALACVASPAAAQITPGSTLTFTGTADATDIGLGGVFLNFMKSVVAAPSGNTGAFASLDRRGGAGARGKITDIRVGNGPEYIDTFLQFGGYKFTLGGLPSGGYGQDECYTEEVAVGQTCTPFQSVQGEPMINAGLSPFYVANVSENSDGSVNSTAAFDLYGTVSGPGGARSLFTGTIAAAFVGIPYQYVLYTLEHDGLRDLTFTGTFTTGAVLPRGSHALSDTETDPLADPTVTPEPWTVALVAPGLLGMFAVRRRRSSDSR